MSSFLKASCGRVAAGGGGGGSSGQQARSEARSPNKNGCWAWAGAAGRGAPRCPSGRCGTARRGPPRRRSSSPRRAAPRRPHPHPRPPRRDTPRQRRARRRLRGRAASGTRGGLRGSERRGRGALTGRASLFLLWEHGLCRAPGHPTHRRDHLLRAADVWSSDVSSGLRDAARGALRAAAIAETLLPKPQARVGPPLRSRSAEVQQNQPSVHSAALCGRRHRPLLPPPLRSLDSPLRGHAEPHRAQQAIASLLCWHHSSAAMLPK